MGLEFLVVFYRCKANTHLFLRTKVKQNMAEINIDDIIERLLEVHGNRSSKHVQLTEQEIRSLCQRAREIFSCQPILLELEAPIKICGMQEKRRFSWSVPK